MHSALGVARLSLALLVVMLPFERALFSVAGLMTVTNLEVMATCSVAFGVWAWLRDKDVRTWPAPALAAAIFVAILLAAALSAPAEPENAVKFTARMAMASLVALVTASIVGSIDDIRRLVRLLVAVAALVGLVAVLEVLQVPGVLNALTVFRPGFHVVAGQLRATSTLFYPTIASMFLEVAFAAGLWLMLEPSRRWERSAAFVALLTIGAAIAATFTRAGLLAMGAVVALFAVIVVARRRDHVAIAWLLGLSMAVAGVVLLLHSPERLATRMSVEGSQAWYGARYEVPRRLALATAQVRPVTVTLTNTGRLAWDSTREPAFALAYHWIDGPSETVVQFEGQRTPFPHVVLPGQSITMQASVVAPGEPGNYTLIWDVVHESRAWLSTEGVTPARTDARVDGAAQPVAATRMARLPAAPSRPARPELWAAAVAIARDHPWLGVGPDNFRFTYGRYAAIERADDRVHANNMYLEVLAGSGIFGLATLLWLMASALSRQIARTCRAPADRLMASTALLGASLLIAAHGMVDSFLGFTTTYLTFAIVGGLAFARAWSAPFTIASARQDDPGARRRDEPGHAHRV